MPAIENIMPGIVNGNVKIKISELFWLAAFKQDTTKLIIVVYVTASNEAIDIDIIFSIGIPNIIITMGCTVIKIKLFAINLKNIYVVVIDVPLSVDMINCCICPV